MISLPLKCLFLAGLCCHGPEGTTRGTRGVRSCFIWLICCILRQVISKFKLLDKICRKPLIKLLLANEGNNICPQNLFSWEHSHVIGWYKTLFVCMYVQLKWLSNWFWIPHGRLNCKICVPLCTGDMWSLHSCLTPKEKTKQKKLTLPHSMSFELQLPRMYFAFSFNNFSQDLTLHVCFTLDWNTD